MAITARSAALTTMLMLAASALHPARAEMVTFGAGADDFISLTIDSTPICTYDGVPAAGCSGVLDMAPGVWYDISIVYKNRFGTNGMSLTWDQVGIPPNAYNFAGGGQPFLVPLANLRTPDGAGGFTAGLRADYFDLAGNPILSVNGEGPLDHGQGSIYQSQPGAWAGVFGYFDTFEERLSGQITLGAIPEPSTYILIGTALALLVGRRARNRGRHRTDTGAGGPREAN